MVDFHAHILPDFDDGAKDVNMSLEMLKESYKQGVDTVVATPHYYAHSCSVESFLKKREERAKILQRETEKADIPLPKLVYGAEVAFNRNLIHRDVERLCIENTNTLLLELPFEYWNKWIYEELFMLSAKKNLNIVIAHVERYIKSRKEIEKIAPLFDLDVKIQVNSGSVTDLFKKKTVDRMFNEFRVDIIGSDMHNVTTRPPSLKKAFQRIERKYGRETVDDLIENSINLI